MNVSHRFLKDFAFLANKYGWTAADIVEIKAETRERGESMVRYWTMLAAAHRAGYEQTPENGYVRLHKWREQQGYPSLSSQPDTGAHP